MVLLKLPTKRIWNVPGWLNGWVGGWSDSDIKANLSWTEMKLNLTTETELDNKKKVLSKKFSVNNIMPITQAEAVTLLSLAIT